MYKFGKGSKTKLESVHHDLVKILNLAISRSPLDFGISEGHRSLERQKELYDQGKSKIDGISKKGKHNYSPSLAVDVYIYHPDLETRKKLAYDVPSLCIIAGVITSCAKELEEKGDIKHSIRWGGNWDNDNVILYDQSFDDLPHFELV
jgi:peptidoglycan L-alanyl-D-glutamate endopeptidase CwlK